MNFAPSFLLVLTLLLAAAPPGADAKALASVSDKSYATTATGVNGATISQIEIYAGTSLIGTSNASPASATWYAVIPGVYTLTAKAYDSQGATATSAPVTVTITAAPGETITFLHNDLAGNPIAATDINGAIVWRESYSPYGDRQKIQAASSANRQWFGGKPLDSETGLSYYGARYYDPFLGRFMGIDAVGFSEGNIHSFNRCAYGNNNPYRFIDPDGRPPFEMYDPANGGRVPSAAEQFRPYGEAMGRAIEQVGAWYLIGMSVLLPELGGTARVAEVLGGSSIQALKLEKALASEAQTAKILAGEGEVIAGKGSNIPLKQASRLEKEVGGKAEDWSKVRGGSHVAKDGTKIETHAFENKVTNQTTQIKTKLKDEGQ